MLVAISLSASLSPGQETEGFRFAEDEGRLTDAPNDAVRLAGPPIVPAGAELDRIDVVIRLRRTDT